MGKSAPRKTGQKLLGVFARYWHPGAVKTRLARHVGDERAAALHRQFVETTLSRLAGLADQHWLLITPAEAISRLASECLPARAWQRSAQSDGDLGQRMHCFFQSAERAADRIVLIGSDSPDLPPRYIDVAWDELTRAPVVLGPAEDGGYYLIGVASAWWTERGYSCLLDDMPWSQPDLLSATLGRLDSMQIGYRLLPPWRDVDEWDDLVALHDRLAAAQLAAGDPLFALRAELAAVIADHEPKRHTHA